MHAPVDKGADKLEDFNVAAEKFTGCCVIRFLKLFNASFMVKAM